MAFEPKMYKAAQPKPLPVILMLDGSGSMSSKGKIESLNEAVQKMIHTFSQQTQRGMEIWVAIIVFKENSAYVHTEYTPVQKLEAKGTFCQVPALCDADRSRSRSKQIASAVLG